MLTRFASTALLALMSALAATQSGYAAQSSFFGDEVMLNPQPLPPRVQFSYGDEVTINPQPLPPRVSIYGTFGDEVMLNPQPLPPRVTQFSYGDEVTINPQPLPPRVLTLPPEYFAVQE